MVVLVICKNEGQIIPESVVVSGQHLNIFKFSCTSSSPAIMKMIQLKMKELEWSQHFSYYKPMGFFSRRSRAAYSAALSLICPNFELVRDFMVVLITCKRKEDLIKNEGAIVHNIIHQFFRRSRADNSRVGCDIWPKLIQAIMHCLITCKN